MNDETPSRLARFIGITILMNFLCAVLWTCFITDRLYNCTDDALPDYFFPGSWVHGEVAYVPEIKINRPMSEPDTIKLGWSRAGLWALWLGCVALSASVGLLASRGCPAQKEGG